MASSHQFWWGGRDDEPLKAGSAPGSADMRHFADEAFAIETLVWVQSRVRLVRL